jgi:hypothetical protein
MKKINDMTLFKEKDKFELGDILLLQSIEQRKLEKENERLNKELEKKFIVLLLKVWIIMMRIHIIVMINISKIHLLN